MKLRSICACSPVLREIFVWQITVVGYFLMIEISFIFPFIKLVLQNIVRKTIDKFFNHCLNITTNLNE